MIKNGQNNKKTKKSEKMLKNLRKKNRNIEKYSIL